MSATIKFIKYNPGWGGPLNNREYHELNVFADIVNKWAETVYAEAEKELSTK
jgi:hypothetical protein